MRPLSNYVAGHLSDMLAMSPSKLAKRMRCSARNADLAQKLIVLTLVKTYRCAQGIDTADLEARGQVMASQMARAKEGELASVFASLLDPEQTAAKMPWVRG